MRDSQGGLHEIKAITPKSGTVMSCFRDVKTTNEIRARHGLVADRDELETEGFLVKSRRSWIPSAWDDISRTRDGRSWKNYRRTKWRA